MGCCVHHRVREPEPLPVRPLETDTLYPYGPYPGLTGVDHLASGYKYYNGMRFKVEYMMFSKLNTLLQYSKQTLQ